MLIVNAARASRMAPEEELVRMAALLLRRTIGTQSETVVELSRAGFQPARIAELLGTTAGTVSQALVKSKKKGAK
ncbi:MAG TPA: hypothetical protein VJT75_14630 [Thermoleophilaceae bacterium]|nr:hypothetical protein [Thermoleophilaceae bacterium]